MEKTKDEVIINGKYYPMWSQFVERKREWIGGILEDFGDSIDKIIMKKNSFSTEITDILLEPNGKDSAMFTVKGKDFDCGFDVGYGGISEGEDKWITFSGYGGHKWRIKAK